LTKVVHTPALQVIEAVDQACVSCTGVDLLNAAFMVLFLLVMKSFIIQLTKVVPSPTRHPFAGGGSGIPITTRGDFAAGAA